MIELFWNAFRLWQKINSIKTTQLHFWFMNKYNNCITHRFVFSPVEMYGFSRLRLEIAQFYIYSAQCNENNDKLSGKWQCINSYAKMNICQLSMVRIETKFYRTMQKKTTCPRRVCVWFSAKMRKSIRNFIATEPISA